MSSNKNTNQPTRATEAQRAARALGDSGKSATEAVSKNSESFERMTSDHRLFGSKKATGEIDQDTQFSDWERDNTKKNAVSEQDDQAAVNKFSMEFETHAQNSGGRSHSLVAPESEVLFDEAERIHSVDAKRRFDEDQQLAENMKQTRPRTAP